MPAFTRFHPVCAAPAAAGRAPVRVPLFGSLTPHEARRFRPTHTEIPGGLDLAVLDINLAGRDNSLLTYME